MEVRFAKPKDGRLAAIMEYWNIKTNSNKIVGVILYNCACLKIQIVVSKIVIKTKKQKLRLI